MIRSYKNPIMIMAAAIACWVGIWLTIQTQSVESLMNQVISDVALAALLLMCLWYVFSYKEVDSRYIRIKLLGIEVGRMDIASISKIYERNVMGFGSLSFYRWDVEGDAKGKKKIYEFRLMEMNKDKIFRHIIDLRPGQVEVDPAVFVRLEKYKEKVRRG